MERVVIVGAGQGGLQVAMSLRQKGYEGGITLIGDEPGLPYERPPLSKDYMKDGDAEALAIRPESWFADNFVELRSGTRVARIDRSARTVTTDADERIAYDHLVLATGASNAQPPVDGLDRDGVFDLRGLADADRLRAAVEDAACAVVIGGGFIGLEFAAVARAAGLDVTVVEMADRLMARVVTPPISARFLAHHREAGVAFRLGVGAEAVEGDGRAGAVRLSDGSRLSCDLVLIATGVAPNVGLAEAAGLRIDDGIVVDGHLLTSDPAISALGDAAAFPGPHGSHVRLESVQAATDHARHIAGRMTGEAEAQAYDAVPWFWSEQDELKLQIAGLSQAAETQVARPEGGPADAVFSFADDRLVAVETVNRPIVHMAARKVLARHERPTRAALESADFDLRAYAKASG